MTGCRPIADPSQALAARLGAMAVPLLAQITESDQIDPIEDFAQRYDRALDERAAAGDAPSDRWQPALPTNVADFVGTWHAEASLVFGVLDVTILADGTFIDTMPGSHDEACTGSGKIEFDARTQTLTWGMDFNRGCWSGGPVTISRYGGDSFVMEYDDGDALAETVIFRRRL